MSNLIFMPFLTFLTALPNTSGASQSQSKSLAVAQNKLNKVIACHSNFAPKRVHCRGAGVGRHICMRNFASMVKATFSR